MSRRRRRFDRSFGPIGPHVGQYLHGFDFTVEGGGGVRRSRSEPVAAAGFIRAGLGAAHLLDRVYLSEQLAYEYSSVSSVTISLSAKLSAPSFWFAEGGALVDREQRFGGRVVFGWGVLGLVDDLRGAEQRSTGLWLKLVAPYWALRLKPFGGPAITR